MTSRLEPGADHSIRVRLEGRLEVVEGLTAQWRRLAQTLRSDGWQGQVETLNEPSEQSDDLAEARSALARMPEARPHLRQLDAARAEANEWAAKRVRELGFPLVEGESEVKQLLALRPIRYHLARVSPTRLLALAGAFAGIASFIAFREPTQSVLGGVAVMVALRFHYGRRRFITITDRAVSITGRVLELEAIDSVLVVEKKLEGGESQGPGEMIFQLKNNTTESLALWEDPAPILLLMRVKGLYAKTRFHSAPPSGD